MKLGDVLAPPDDALLEAGAGGERLVAQVRLVFFGTLCLVPIAILTIWPDSPREVRVGAVAGAVGLGFSLVLAWMGRRFRVVPGLAFVTSAFDVTLVSATLFAFALSGRPHVAVNSMVVWEIYLLAILATPLRFDLRVCIVAGLLSLAQYGALLWWITRRWDVTSPDVLVPSYGPTSWPIQAARLILMLAATALASGIVLRMRRLMHISGTDRLTGLANRAYFDGRLAAELSRARRSGRPLTLAFMDLDRFKQLNDRFGHEVGDQALRHVARILKEESREEDVVARWGGEEFLAVLPDTALPEGVGQAHRVRTALEARPVPHRAGPITLTLSAGCAEFPREAGDGRSLVALADRRLLEAKRRGRNRIVGDDGAAEGVPGRAAV